MSELDRRVVVAGGLSALIAAPASANPGWPERPITVVHGFPPGGPTDLIAKRLDFMMDPAAALIEYVRDGRLRALAVTGPSPFFALPDVATVTQSGLPGYVVTSWQGLLAPARLPAPILARLSAELI